MRKPQSMKGMVVTLVDTDGRKWIVSAVEDVDSGEESTDISGAEWRDVILTYRRGEKWRHRSLRLEPAGLKPVE